MVRAAMNFSARLLLGCAFTFLSLVVAAPQAVVAEEMGCVCRYCAASGGGLGFGVDLGTDGPHYAPIRQVDVLHIKLDITPDFQERTVGGTTTIRFAPLRKPLESLTLDAVDLHIGEVKGSTPVCDHASSPTKLTIAFEEPIPVGQESWVSIEHHCQPTGGFYFRTPEMGYPAEDTHCWTQGEAHFARHWFPCFDYPNERLTSEVICRVPADMTVISNGRMLGESVDLATQTKSVHWLQDKPHVNYLICVVAGYFSKLEDMTGDVPLGFYSQPTLAEHAPRAFQDTAAIMRFFKKEIGMPYPWHKYDQVTIRDFIAGGMENTTITTLTHRTLHNEETENLRSSRGLDAHELAHQWFGNYVTCEDWSHLWLNEGFATYYTHLYEGEKLGRDALLYGLYRDAQQRILTRAEDTRPIVWNRYRNAGEQFDYRAYPKGSWVLHMLRSQLGEDLFRQAVQTYLQRHALSTVTTPDLQRTFEQVSGRTWERFFDQWVYHGRFPDVKIRYRYDPATAQAHVTLEQTHTTSDEVLTFAFPAEFAFYCEEGDVVTHVEEVTNTKHEFYVKLPGQPQMVCFDPRYTLLARVDFEQPEAMWLTQLSDAPTGVGRIAAAEALAKKGTHKAVAALQQALEIDPFFGVRVEAAKALGKMTQDDALEALLATLPAEDARVRLAQVEAIARFYRPENVSRYLESVESEPNPAIVAAWIRGLAKYSDESVTQYLRDALQQESFRNEIAEAAVEAMAQSRSSVYVPALANALATRADTFTSRGKVQLLWALATLSQHPEQKQQALKWIAPYLNAPLRQVRVGAIAALGQLKLEEARPLLEGLAAAEADEEVSKQAKQALAQLTRSETPQPQELIQLRTQVQSLEEANRKLQEKFEDLEKRLTPVEQP